MRLVIPVLLAVAAVSLPSVASAHYMATRGTVGRFRVDVIAEDPGGGDSSRFLIEAIRFAAWGTRISRVIPEGTRVLARNTLESDSDTITVIIRRGGARIASFPIPQVDVHESTYETIFERLVERFQVRRPPPLVYRRLFQLQLDWTVEQEELDGVRYWQDISERLERHRVTEHDGFFSRLCAPCFPSARREVHEGRTEFFGGLYLSRGSARRALEALIQRGAVGNRARVRALAEWSILDEEGYGAEIDGTLFPTLDACRRAASDESDARCGLRCVIGAGGPSPACERVEPAP